MLLYKIAFRVSVRASICKRPYAKLWKERIQDRTCVVCEPDFFHERAENRRKGPNFQYKWNQIRIKGLLKIKEKETIFWHILKISVAN